MSGGLLHPEWRVAISLLLLAVAAAVAVARWRAARRLRRLGPDARPGITWYRDLALWLALGCIGLALLGPRVGERTVRVSAAGVDVVLLIDVSRSMDARDVAPSRLLRAQRAAEELLARLSPADRVALAVFAGQGVLMAPLSPDHGALAELVRALDSEIVRPASSDLAAGVAAAVTAFEAGSERPRVVVLLSDGEDPERRATLGIGDAVRAESRLVVLAVGSEAGAQIVGSSGPLRDVGGQPVVTRRHAERLERAAAATRGALFLGDAFGDFDFDTVAAEVRRGASDRPGETLEKRVPAVPVAPLAGLAFALLVVEGLRFPRLARRLPALALAGLLLGAGPPGAELAALEAQARAQPDSARAWIELGLARLERGQREAGEQALRAAALRAREAELAGLAYYDLGVAALERADLEGARDAFFDALALTPADGQARFNLEWTLAALDRRPPETPDTPEAPPAAPAPEPEPDADETEPAEAQTPTPPREATDAEQLRRLLDRVRDDPSAAMRAAARALDETGRPRRGPAW